MTPAARSPGTISTGPTASRATLPAYSGGTPFSYANIAPANAWVGIAQENQNRRRVLTSSSPVEQYFQVAPTFGWFTHWAGLGGSQVSRALGSDLYPSLGLVHGGSATQRL